MGFFSLVKGLGQKVGRGLKNGMNKGIGIPGGGRRNKNTDGCNYGGPGKGLGKGIGQGRNRRG